LSILLDLGLGEPPYAVHPTVWMGRVISYLKPRIKNENPLVERINGVLLALAVVASFSIPTYIILFLVREYRIAYVIVSAILLKPTFAIRCMVDYTVPISEAIESNRIEEARKQLPKIVRREPTTLGSEHIISAAVETIAEGTVDGITSPLFFFAVFGVPGAVIYRVVNTLDSMVGYKDEENVNIGWFSARLDTILNYLPARITALLMVLVGALLNENWKNAWNILKRDRNKTESINGGWTMSAMAGVLNVQLEKIGYYIIGDKSSLLPEHVLQALLVMKISTFLFIVFPVIPVIYVMKIMIG
jgi:adenosylcobinamide-phosphate synthase